MKEKASKKRKIIFNASFNNTTYIQQIYTTDIFRSADRIFNLSRFA